MANAGEIRARLVLNNEEFKTKMQQTRDDMKNTGFSAQQMNKDFGAIQKMSGVVGAAVLAGIGGSVKVAADFEQSMARVNAISGATDEEFARLETTAREMGAATIFSASEAAEGLSYLAMAGFDVDQQISALPAVLNAAIAGQIELGQSADIVSNIMTGFGISADDAGMAVDVLVKASTTANTDIPMLGEGMKMVAPVAEALGWTIQETSAALGKLSDAGIQGSQSGTVLRAALLALANPTGQTADAMEDLGIEVLNSEGNMKPLPELMGHISEKMDGLTDAQKTQAAAQLVGTQAAAGFIALLEVGEEGLADYVTELENSAGAAQEMADIQANTLNGAFKEFQSAVEEAGIKLGKEFLPMFTGVVRVATDVVNSFDEVNAGQAKTALAFLGTTAAIGGTLATIGKLILAISGLLASLGPAGWLIIGVSLLGGALAALTVNMKDSKEINTEVAESYRNQADELQVLVDEYDELNAKSRLTTKEFGRLMDIQTELNRTQDPSKIAALNKEYDELAEKSGLSKDEIIRLIEANDGIIEQSPEVEKSFTDQGDAVVESTDAIQSYINKLNEMAMIELEAARAEAIAQENELIKEQEELRTELLEIEQDMRYHTDAQLMSEDARNARLEEIGRELDDHTLTHKEIADLQHEEVALEQAQLGLAGKALASLREQRETIMEKINLNEEELGKLELIEAQMADLILSEVDLNWEKGEGLSKLDEAIKKLQDERSEIEKNTSSEGKKTQEYRDQIGELDTTISKHLDVRDRIRDELGLQSEQNSKSKEQNRHLNESKFHIDQAITKTKNQGTAQDGTNKKISNAVTRAIELTKELSKDVKKDVEVDDKGKPDSIHQRLAQAVTKPVSIVESVTRFFKGETKHGGGIVGDGTSTGVASSHLQQIPKLHTGGIAADLMNRPLHNEIDVRLLQNEMVLTEGQQANLWNFLEHSNFSADYVDSEQLVALTEKQNTLMSNILAKIPEGIDQQSLFNLMSLLDINNSQLLKSIIDELYNLEGTGLRKKDVDFVNNKIAEIGSRDNAAWGGK